MQLEQQPHRAVILRLQAEESLSWYEILRCAQDDIARESQATPRSISSDLVGKIKSRFLHFYHLRRALVRALHNRHFPHPAEFAVAPR